MTLVKVHKNLNVSLNNTTLERVYFLELLIDECLTWKQHIDFVSQTISRNTDMSKRQYSISSRFLQSTCKSYQDKLIKLQKWAIITITNSHYKSHVGSLFAILICFL